MEVTPGSFLLQKKDDIYFIEFKSLVNSDLFKETLNKIEPGYERFYIKRILSKNELELQEDEDINDYHRIFYFEIMIDNKTRIYYGIDGTEFMDMITAFFNKKDYLDILQKLKLNALEELDAEDIVIIDEDNQQYYYAHELDKQLICWFYKDKEAYLARITCNFQGKFGFIIFDKTNNPIFFHELDKQLCFNSIYAISKENKENDMDSPQLCLVPYIADEINKAIEKL